MNFEIRSRSDRPFLLVCSSSSLSENHTLIVHHIRETESASHKKRHCEGTSITVALIHFYIFQRKFQHAFYATRQFLAGGFSRGFDFFRSKIKNTSAHFALDHTRLWAFLAGSRLQLYHNHPFSKPLRIVLPFPAGDTLSVMLLPYPEVFRFAYC